MKFMKVLEKLHGEGPYYSSQIEDVISKVKIYQEDRAKMATEILSGILSSGVGVQFTNQMLVKDAVALADALLAELGNK